MRVEKWGFSAGILFFCLCAVEAWRDGQPGAAFLFIGFVACILVLAGYGLYRKKITASCGPFDPSSNWLPSGNTRAGEVGTFRYSRVDLLLTKAAAWLSTPLAPAIYLVPPRPEGVELMSLILFGTSIFTALYLMYLARKAYSIEIQADAVVVNELERSRAYKFSSFGMVALLDTGGKGTRYVLAVYDKADRVLWKIGDGMDGFQRYVTLMKKRCFEEGITYRYRDMWGSWTK
jgi:hypothetical protein